MKYTFKPRKRISESDLLADLKRVAKKYPSQAITQTKYIKHGKYNHARYWKTFGSWPKALKAAGIEATHLYRIPVADLCSNMKRVWTKLGRQPKYKEMAKPLSKYSPSPYRYLFGTWDKVLKWFVDLSNDPKLWKKTEDHIRNRLESARMKNRNIGLSLRFEIYRRDNFKCRICGRSPAADRGVKLHIDHIIPFSQGGKNIADNLQTLCSDCNRGKGTK